MSSLVSLLYKSYSFVPLLEFKSITTTLRLTGELGRWRWQDVWKSVESSRDQSRESQNGKAEERGERKKEKKMRRKRGEEKGKAKAKERKKTGSMKDSRRMGDLGWRSSSKVRVSQTSFSLYLHN